MKPTRAHLMGFTTVLAAIAIAAPVSTAGADTVTPAVAPAATVVGPTFTTSAPATFINTNTQVSAGANVSGDQVGP